jgi:hypothetical protein
MPFDQLRALVISLIGPEPEFDAEAEAELDAEFDAEFDAESRAATVDDDPVREFDTQATRYLGPRTSTLDQLIAFLRKQ